MFLLAIFTLLAAAPPLRVGTIKIVTEPLFSAEEASRGGFYRGANAVAVRTDPALIRAFLLLHEGDPFDEAKMHESERNLRNFDFLKSVTITASSPHDGVVDLTVSTQDEFTTALNLDYSNDGGRSIYDIDITQENLFGTGSQISLRTASLTERKTNSIEYLHPAIFGSYWTADALLANSSDGNEQRLSVTRPLFSYTTKYTLDSLVDRLLQNERVYEDGVIRDLFAQNHRALTFLPGFAIASHPGSTTRIIGGIDWSQDTFQPIEGATPANRDFRFVEMGIDHSSLRFLNMAHVNLGLKAEDFSLGSHTSLIGGATSNGVFRVTFDQSWGHAFDPTNFVQTRIAATTRARAENQNQILSSDSWFVKQWGSSHPNTLVVRNRIDLGRDTDLDVQFFADGQNGLRSYPNFSFAGTRRMAFNIEDRWSLGSELLQLVEPGIAAFADIGTATNRSLLNEKYHSDFGLGLRLGIARYQSAMLRFDFGYAATDSPLQKRGLVFSFATSQAF